MNVISAYLIPILLGLTQNDKMFAWWNEEDHTDIVSDAVFDCYRKVTWTLITKIVKGHGQCLYTVDALDTVMIHIVDKLHHSLEVCPLKLRNYFQSSHTKVDYG